MTSSNCRSYLFLLVLMLSLVGVAPVGAQEGATAQYASATRQIRLDQGKQYLDQGQYDQAITLFQKVLREDSENKSARKYLAQAQEEKGIQPTSAEIQKDSAKQQQAETKAKVKELLAQSSDALKKGDLAKARETYEKIKELDPQNSKAAKGLVRVAKAEEEKHSAEEAAKQEALTKAEKERQATNEGKIAEALKKASQMLSKGECNGAIAAYKEVLDMDSQNAKALKGIDKAKKAQAEADAEKLAAQENSKKEAATKAAETQQQIRDGKIDGALSRAANLKKVGDYSRALEAYKEALELDPQNKKAIKGQNLVQKEIERDSARKKDLDEAKLKADIAQAEKAQSIARANKIDESVNRGYELSKKGDFVNATAAFNEALNVDPQNKKALKALRQIQSDKAQKEAEARSNEEARKNEADAPHSERKR